MNKKTIFFLGLLIILAISIGPASAQPSEEDGIQESVKTALEKREKGVENEKRVTLKVRGGRVREKPSLDSTVKFVLKKGDTVSVIETMGNWYHVELDNGRMGWSHQSLYSKKISLNLFNVDIRKALSALAMKQEINIATAKEVSGKISVHLYQVTLDEALEAITLAGGFHYIKSGELYYIYQPKKAEDPLAKRLSMRVFKLRYTEIEKIQRILDSIPGMRMIKIHKPSKTIIVQAMPEDIEKIELIIRHWDTLPKQVMIEAKILEVTLTDDMSLGVDWEKILGDVTIGTGGLSTAIKPSAPGTSPVPGTGTGLFANLIASAGTEQQFAAALDALRSVTRVDILSTPKILAIHGKRAKVLIGGKQGYRVTTVNQGISTETIEFIDTGTILEITPYIDDDGNVLLNVRPSIKAAKIQVGGIPVVSSTEVSTWLVAKNGESIFIGGLIQDTKTKTREMLPCLGRIPLIGVLFGRTYRSIGKTELIVLITPTILDAERRAMDQETTKKIKKMEERIKKEPLPLRKEFLEFSPPPE
jgi:type II secretory pathway component GspD/PulD (secretin)